MLIAILMAEYCTDLVDWLGSDAGKRGYNRAPGSFSLWKNTTVTPGKSVSTPAGSVEGPPTVSSSTWSGVGKIAFGLGGIAMAVLAELTLLPIIGKKADDQ
jgi:hypothetical protein